MIVSSPTRQGVGGDNGGDDGGSGGASIAISMVLLWFCILKFS